MADDTPQQDKAFLCQAQMTKNSEMSFDSYYLNSTAVRAASTCPMGVDTNTAVGTRNMNCAASSQAWKPPFFLQGPSHEERMAQAANGSSCRRGLS